MSQDQIIEDIRVANARALVQEAGSQVRFGLRMGMSRGQVNHIVGPSRVKAIGSELARRIETVFGRPVGWLDVAHDQPATSLADDGVVIGRIAAGSAFAAVPGLTDGAVHQMTVGKDWLRQSVGARPTVYVAMATVQTDEMEPELRRGSVVLVDRSVTSITGDGIYVLRRRDDAPGHERFRRLVKEIDGTISLRAANPAYTSASVASLKTLGLVILGRVIAALEVRPV